MPDKILERSKNIVISYLTSIGTTIEENDELYKLEIPEEYSNIFGGRFKRITFSMDVAAENACELVAPGSNILANVIEEWRKRAPVVKASLLQNVSSDLKTIGLNSVNAELYIEKEETFPRQAICFYYLVNMKQIKRRMELRTVTVDLNDLSIRGPRGDIVFNEFSLIPDESPIELDPNHIEATYSKSIKELEQVISDETREFLTEGESASEKEIEIVRKHYEMRRKEIHDDLEYIRSRIKEFQKKMASARSHKTLTQYAKKKSQEEEKLEEETVSAGKKLKMLDKEEEIEIEKIKKRYQPRIEYSLIAAVVIRYNDSLCKAVLKNEYAAKNLEVNYDNLSKHLESIKCEICTNPVSSIYLCNEAHLTCVNCSEACIDCNKYYCKNCGREKLAPCYICRDELCSECRHTCKICALNSCNSHTKICNKCSILCCFFCSNECQICKSSMCREHFKYCQICGIAACVSHNSSCQLCSLTLCTNHKFQCPICIGTICSSHSSRCKNCNQNYCPKCLTNDICNTCKDMNEKPLENQYTIILGQHNADLIKLKKWKSGENSKFVILRSDAFLKHHLLVIDKLAKKVVHHEKHGVRA